MNHADAIEWTTAPHHYAVTVDWAYRITEYLDGRAELSVRRSGTRPSALAYKRDVYASAEHAMRAAARYERTFTHNDGHLRYRDPARTGRVRGWRWNPRYNAGHPDHPEA